MRAVIQRVAEASVTVNGGPERPIGKGLVILLGVRETDTEDVIPKLAEKCAHLRIFEDEAGKLNRSATELGYEALVVSNFTLYGDTSRGKRPSFSHAAKADLAWPACSTASLGPICRCACATTAPSPSSSTPTTGKNRRRLP